MRHKHLFAIHLFGNWYYTLVFGFNYVYINYFKILEVLGAYKLGRKMIIVHQIYSNNPAKIMFSTYGQNNCLNRSRLHVKQQTRSLETSYLEL